jgi:hypothetical protein
MIAPHLVEQVRQLLVEGKTSHRKIARITGVSRGTIGAIASGRRCIRPRPTWPWEDEPLVPDTPPERCPDCGGMVYMPCRACRARKAISKLPGRGTTIQADVRQQGRTGMFALLSVPLGLNLKPVHRERYEEVRRWRREQCWGNNYTVAPGVAVQLPAQHI